MTQKENNLKFMRMQGGKLVPSRFGGGSIDATKHTPVSFKNANSYYSRLLQIMHDVRTSGTAWRTGEQIATLFYEKYGEKKRQDSIVKLLSRFYVWGLVDYREGADKRGGSWSLRPEIDISDVDSLLLRARTAQILFAEVDKGDLHRHALPNSPISVLFR